MPPVDVPALRALLAKAKEAKGLVIQGCSSLALYDADVAEFAFRSALRSSAESLLDRVEELEGTLASALSLLRQGRHEMALATLAAGGPDAAAR